MIASRSIVFLAILALATPALSQGQPKLIQLKLAKNSSLRLEGDSTLHAFSSAATALALRAGLTVPEGSNENVHEALLAGRPLALELKIDVTDLKSGDSQLDKNLYAALKASRHPQIVFKLERYELGSSTLGDDRLQLIGSLAVAGQTNPIEIPVVVRVDGGALRVRGAVEVRMTTFGITPPTFFAVVKTADRIAIKFDLALEASLPKQPQQVGVRSSP
jgi:hypothetical protein